MHRIARVSLLLALVSLSAVAVAQPTEPPAAPPATGFVQTKADLILSIVNSAIPASADIDAKRAELRAALREFLSFDVMAERTLGDHWETRTSEQRVEFVGLLRDLIETSYSRSIGTGTVDAGTYAVEFTGERSRRDRTTVEATVTVEGETHIVEVKMQDRAGAWIVYDLVTDDVSLEESYAESFESIIADEGWDGLLQRMRDRLQEMRAEL